MRFLVFGAGAMGSLVGAFLSRKHETMLVGRGPHVAAIRRDGLRVSGHTELVAHPEAVEALPKDADPEVVIVAVKAYDTTTASQILQPLAERAVFLSLQNGLGNEEALAKTGARILGGVTNQGITFLGPGKIHHAGAGDTYVGPFERARHEDAVRVVDAFTESGMPSHPVEDIRGELWLKAIVNACINPITALLRTPNGYVLETEATRQIVREVIREGVDVARRYGTRLDPEVVFERVDSVVRGTAENRSSMLQDVERGRRTEVDAINGAIARLGAAQNQPAPTNALLARLVVAAEKAPRSR